MVVPLKVTGPGALTAKSRGECHSTSAESLANGWTVDFNSVGRYIRLIQLEDLQKDQVFIGFQMERNMKLSWKETPIVIVLYGNWR